MAIVRAEVSKTGSASPSSECNGSLFLNSRHGSPAVFLTGQFSLEEIKNLHKKKLLVADVEVHGCGCFHVYSKRNGRGLRFNIRSDQRIEKGDYRLFKYAKSIKRVLCKSSNKY